MLGTEIVALALEVGGVGLVVLFDSVSVSLDKLLEVVVVEEEEGDRSMGRPAREAWMWEYEGEGERCVPGPGV